MEYTFKFLPPRINNPSEMAEVLKTSPSVLGRASHAPEKFYRRFKIKKRSGADRSIEAPLPSLYEIQKHLYREVLSSVICSDAAHGFVKGRSIVSHASAHREGKEFFLADLENFFPSIGLPRVISVYAKLGYNHEIATTLALLSTLDQRLPQGAPTSPYISNICSLVLDARLTELSNRYGLVYTRYADDMAFSGARISLRFCEAVREIVREEGFNVNERKSLLMRNHGKVIITGISLSRGRLCVPRETKRRIRSEAHFLARNGVIKESGRSGIFDPLHVDRVLGRLTYWSLVEPDNQYPVRMKAEIQQQLTAAGFV